eukprot:PhM_4_TR13913/c0_g1_i1/m.39854/K15920/XYL4; beta-D-xylosidase 4
MQLHFPVIPLVVVATLLLMCVTQTIAKIPSGSPLMLWGCSSSDDDGAQLFQFNSTDKTFRMANDTTMCMDIRNYGTTLGSLMFISGCHTDDKDPSHQNQEWDKKTNGGEETFQSIISSFCLGTGKNVNGSYLQLVDCASDTAAWSLLPVSSKPNAARLQLKGTDLCAHAGDPFRSNPCVSDPYQSMPFCNVSKPIDERVNDIVQRLSVPDKVHLLGNSAQFAFGAGLPAYQWWGEGLHGLASSPSVTFGGVFRNATSFAQVGLTAATFDEDIFARVGRAIGREARVFSNNGQAGLTFWAPNINIFRDPRWGRGQETPGEDPLLSSTYAKNFVSAFQRSGEDPDRLVASACCKHFDAYSMELWGGTDRHHFNAVVTDQDMTDTYLPAFEACAHKDGGAASSFMCSYNAVNGVPSCANKYLLTDLARTAWGFDGYISGDCGATDDVQYSHHYTNNSDATCQATLRAGMDLDCGWFLQAHSDTAYDDKAIDDKDLNNAVTHLLRTQMRLGLFDPDNIQPFKKLPNSIVNSAEHQALAREAAAKGMVLLENHNQTLPFNASKIKTIAVIGPNADTNVTMQGNYGGDAPFLVTPKMGLAERVNVKYAKGSELTGDDTSGFRDACNTAQGVDAFVIVIGLNQSIESEALDRMEISLPDIQRQLIDNVSICAAGKPVVVAVMSGGPIDLTPVRDNGLVKAMLWIGYPGQAGGQALADVLFGSVPPSGRLPYTVYQSDYVNQVSMLDMGMRPNTTTGNPGRTYRFFTGTAVYPLGYGLSYSNFTYKPKHSELNVTMETITSDLTRLPRHTTFGAQKLSTVTFRVVNVGTVDTEHTVLCYASGPNAGVGGRPIKALIGFQRISLSAGSFTDVSFDVTSISLSFVNEQGFYSTDRGVWRFYVHDDESSMTRVVVN